MGIRVHKVIGFGLTDVESDPKTHEIRDERFDPTGFLCRGVYADDYDDDAANGPPYTAEGYSQFLDDRRTDPNHEVPIQDRMALNKHLDNSTLHHWYPHRSAVYEPEFGMDNVLVIVPFWACRTYHRVDDTIDWSEETIRGATNRVVNLDRTGIHPYTSLWDPITMSKAPQSALMGVRDIESEIKSGNLEWHVPNDVRELCTYLKVFRSPETIQTLKPLLYVYWS